ncbi:MAG: HAD-IB family hydrolase [Nanoarchaeota archaeon]
MKKKNIAAFFDFDGTIYHGLVAFDIFRFAFGRGIMSFSEMIKLSTLSYYYMLDKFNLAGRISINKRLYKKIKGLNSKELFESASEKFFLHNKNKKFYADIMDIIEWHAKKGHRIVVVTSTIKEIVNPARKWIKIDEILATEVETKNGIYTGTVKILPVGQNRINVIKDYCKKYDIDLSRSYAYSDHFSDIPLLESIGNAIVTGPDRRLRAHAMKKGWKIIDHR